MSFTPHTFCVLWSPVCLQLFVFGASFNTERGALSCDVFLAARGEGALWTPSSCPDPPWSALVCLQRFTFGRPGLPRQSTTALLPLAGLGPWSREETGLRKERSWVSPRPSALEYLGYSPSACQSERWGAFVAQIRDLFLFLLFSFPSFPPPSKGYCFSSQAVCIDDPWRKGVLQSWDVWVLGIKRQDEHFSLPCFLSLASSQRIISECVTVNCTILPVS